MKKKLLLISFIILIMLLFYFFYIFNKEYLISSYSTSLKERDPSQLNNIIYAASMINNIKIKPGKVFSFNSTVGERTDPYFRKAKAVVGNKIEDASGGGICQLSSTLYNAALLANLKITERHPHNIAVSSVPPGLDATVSYGFYDLKFKNPYPFPLKVTAKAKGERLIISIYGKKIKDKTRIITEEVPDYNPGIKHVKVWREITDKSGKITKEFISDDIYSK
ncbi:MAG: VanW family protein [Armatimonadota bacterium]